MNSLTASLLIPMLISLFQNIGNVTAELELQRLQQEQLRRQEMVRRGQHGMYAGPHLGLLPLLEQMRPQQQSNVSNYVL